MKSPSYFNILIAVAFSALSLKAQSDGATVFGNDSPKQSGAIGWLDNCGFSTSSFVLEWFAKEPLNPTEKAMFGKDMENPVSFEDLSNIFEKRGLIVHGYGDASACFIAKNLSNGYVAIIHSTKSNHNHYLAAASLSRSCFITFDYPKLPLRSDGVSFLSTLAQVISGNVLLIATHDIPVFNDNPDTISVIPKSVQPSSDIIANSETKPSEIEMLKGDMITTRSVVNIQAGNVQQDFIRISTTIANHGHTPLGVFKGNGSCGCFVSFDGPKSINPGESAEYKMVFSTDKFDFTHGTSVAVVTDDPSLKTALIKVRTDEMLLRKMAEIRVFPTDFNLGVISSHTGKCYISLYINDLLNPNDIIADLKIQGDCKPQLVDCSVIKKCINDQTVTVANLTVSYETTGSGFFKNIVRLRAPKFLPNDSLCTLSGYMF